MNLTTPCTSLKFNCTGEILGACSSHAENAVKLVSDYLNDLIQVLETSCIDILIL